MAMENPFEGKEVWFGVGSQDLYGEEALRQVAEQSGEIVDALNATGKIPVKVVLKHHLDRDLAGCVERVDDFAGLLGHLTQRFLAVQILGSDAEPDFLAFKRVFHCHVIVPLLRCLWSF